MYLYTLLINRVVTTLLFFALLIDYSSFKSFDLRLLNKIWDDNRKVFSETFLLFLIQEFLMFHILLIEQLFRLKYLCQIICF